MFDFKASLRLALVAASAWTFHEVRAEGEAPVGEARPMYIREYRVRGVKSGVVGSAEIGEAVYP
ncbi:hypothetical protein ACFQ5Q_19385, partial [Luteolibacter ambystomatis]